jgi:hypothetical protein
MTCVGTFGRGDSTVVSVMTLDDGEFVIIAIIIPFPGGSGKQ